MTDPYNLIDTIPDSESDKLLNKWGYDLKKDCFDLVKWADIPSEETIFDFATGSGRICSVLTRFGYRIFTGDYSLKDIAKARARITTPYLNLVTFLSLDMERLPFRNSSINNIICLNTLHELNNPLLCINELIRIHSGKGKLVIADFNTTGFELMQRIHEIVYKNDHTTGKIKMNEVRNILRHHYRDVCSFDSSVNISLSASEKV